MLRDSKAFSGFSVNDFAAAKQFYGETLGLDISENPVELTLRLAGGTRIFIYLKENHTAASFTILNFPVDDIDKTIDELTAKGIVFERYDDLPAEQDEKGVLRGRAAKQGPDIAWFTDPSGNILSILQE